MKRRFWSDPEAAELVRYPFDARNTCPGAAPTVETAAAEEM